MCEAIKSCLDDHVLGGFSGETSCAGDSAMIGWPRRCSEYLMMKNVLFISRQRLMGRVNGSSAYLLELAEAVRRAGMTPHLVQPSPSVLGRTPFFRLQSGMGVFESYQFRGVWRFGRLVVAKSLGVYGLAALAILRRLLRQVGFKGRWVEDHPAPYAVAVDWSEQDRAFVRRASRGKSDIAIADYMFQAEAFECLANREVPAAIVMHDLFHQRREAGSPGSELDGLPRIDRLRECEMLARADVVVAIQSAEARFVEAHVPGVQAIVAPMAVDAVAAPQVGDARTLLFIGSNTAPNFVGLEWLFEQVWPLVQARRPELTLQIGGSVVRAFPAGGPRGTQFLGLVEDLSPLYRDAGLVISPLTFGSGLKIKLVEAMAQGKAIVATGITLQGVEDECAGAVAVANAPEEFARQIIELTGDDKRRSELAARALDAARRHFSKEACYRDFTAWLQNPVRTSQ